MPPLGWRKSKVPCRDRKPTYKELQKELEEEKLRFKLLAAMVQYQTRVVRKLYDDYVVDVYGDDVCDCDPSAGIDDCTLCQARRLLLGLKV